MILLARVGILKGSLCLVVFCHSDLLLHTQRAKITGLSAYFLLIHIVGDSRVMLTLLLLCELSGILLDLSHLDSIELINDLKMNSVTLDRYYHKPAKVRGILSQNSKGEDLLLCVGEVGRKKEKQSERGRLYAKK